MRCLILVSLCALLVGCGTIQKMIDTTADMKDLLKDYGPKIKSAAGQIGGAAKTIGDLAAKVGTGYDTAATWTKDKLTKLEYGLKEVRAQADTNKDGKLDPSEIWKYLVPGGGGLAVLGWLFKRANDKNAGEIASALEAAKSKESRKRGELWAAINEVKNGGAPTSG